MKKLLILVSLASLLANAASASPANIASAHRSDSYQPGRHLFYAWCATGKDRLVSQDGASAADAGAKLAGSPAVAGCRLAWQGRIAS